LFLVLFLAPMGAGQASFQPGHTHDILQVRFSPDSTKLASYSWGDGWLCYWDVASGQLLWKSRTGFIQKADEHANIEAFGWNQDSSLLYTRSENGTFQTWDARTGRILSFSETNPDETALARTKISIRKDYSNFYLHNSETGEDTTIKMFSRTGSAYDVSDDGKLFAEGGSWGNAIIRITEIRKPLNSRDLKGGKILPYVATDLEQKLDASRAERRRILGDAKTQRDKQAVIETESLKKQVYITFEHYRDMKDPGELRMMESGEPNKSKESKPAIDSTAIWVRLHNDSRLPIKIPTQSMYSPNPKCFYEFPGGQKMMGLCDNKEIAVWFGLEDKKGKVIPYGFDFGSSTILLPKTSALFAVAREILRNGNAIRFGFTFQKDDGRDKVSDYGTERILRFRESDLP
jgi:hypothetical protein